jgi:hypothetical protein
MTEEPPSSQHASGSYIVQADRGSAATLNVFNTLSRRFVDPEDRSNLLKLIKSSWISGVLTASLNQTLPIQLNKEIKASVVERSEAARLKDLHQPSGAIPSNQKILEIFEEMERTLLILRAIGHVLAIYAQGIRSIDIVSLKRDAYLGRVQMLRERIPVVYAARSRARVIVSRLLAQGVYKHQVLYT